ncbi:DUF3152 domain-containing protein [Streptomyces sp. VNUA24]|uniref:DUF3152 domain-containing protein n=1 Tax=Streptomyces sp. VNUA24 TaxID=3031131 RepID=UPI0023B84FC9|nr:DUF3152 domain-containing protein [Streptomyces sp. VNUA24]WEH18249.1 DUF3152 domain-containing protein [Streptomyces sp. VNUA24]
MTVLGVAGFAAVSWMNGGAREVSAEAEPTPSAESPSERSRRSPGPGSEPATGSRPGPGRSSGSDAGARQNPSSSPSASSPSSAGPSPDGSASSSPGGKRVTIPATGPGTFRTASGGSRKVGEGTPLRYRVEVEKGLSLSLDKVADEVEGVLADPRGWTAGGDHAFQRVSSGAFDFVVKVATPGTVDDVCGAGGLDTGGEFNCNVNDDVMVNLERWELATPVYAEDVPAYRALIINHEVGHFLGQGHVGCPGKGKPAPAMMQQIKGMNGCVPNVWPYDTKGRALTGPAVP